MGSEIGDRWQGRLQTHPCQRVDTVEEEASAKPAREGQEAGPYRAKAYYGGVFEFDVQPAN